MVKRSYSSFSDVVDSFVRDQMFRQTDATAMNSIVYGENYQFYKGVLGTDDATPSAIRDLEDDVMYFMIGIDKVGSYSKVGA